MDDFFIRSAVIFCLLCRPRPNDDGAFVDA